MLRKCVNVRLEMIEFEIRGGNGKLKIENCENVDFRFRFSIFDFRFSSILKIDENLRKVIEPDSYTHLTLPTICSV